MPTTPAKPSLKASICSRTPSSMRSRTPPPRDRADHSRHGREQEHRRDRELDAVRDGAGVDGECHGANDTDPRRQ